MAAKFTHMLGVICWPLIREGSEGKRSCHFNCDTGSWLGVLFSPEGSHCPARKRYQGPILIRINISKNEAGKKSQTTQTIILIKQCFHKRFPLKKIELCPMNDVI